MSFEALGMGEAIIRGIAELGFVHPTPIQKEAIPLLLSSDRDLIALAQTGTGKTAAFGLPAIQNTDVSMGMPQCLILCPTRELCVQISADLERFAKYVKELNIVAVYGGARIEAQIRALKRGAHIVVGTPGRVRDLIKRKKLLLGEVRRIVLDEADEMLSMGFKEELDEILSSTPKEKQTILFSATMHKKMHSITKKYLDDPLQIAVSKVNEATKLVEHRYYVVRASDRYELLKRLADINPNIYAIVFCRTRRDSKSVANKLMADGYDADALHGDLSQAQRDEVMGRFRKKHLQILVATDVAARGLDVQELTHIINFQMPDDDESYIHRSGRTGRAGNLGVSVVIITARERRRIRDIEKYSGIRFRQMAAPTGKEICEKQLFTLIDRIEKIQVDEAQIAPFLDTIYAKLNWLSREELIKRFVSVEFNRFLEYYRDAKDINVSEKVLEKRREKVDIRSRRETPFCRFFVQIGSKNKLTPTRLIGLINQMLDSNDALIGKIEILRNFSFFEIDESLKKSLIASAKNVKFGGVPIQLELAKESEYRKVERVKKKKVAKNKAKARSRSFGDSKKRGRQRRYRN